jgi:hypothetical protein
MQLNFGTLMAEVGCLKFGVRHGYPSAIVFILLLTTHLKCNENVKKDIYTQ